MVLRYPLGTAVATIAVLVGAAVAPLAIVLRSSSPTDAANHALDQLSVLVVALVLVVTTTAVKLLLARRAVRSATADNAVPVTISLLRQHRFATARSWVEVTLHRPGSPRRLWSPVYFDPNLLSLQPNSAAQMTSSGRLLGFTADGLLIYPSGAARRTEPPGQLIDAPALSGNNLARRIRALGTWRRRLATDGLTASGGIVVSALWTFASGSGVWTFAVGTVVAIVAGFWFTATVVGTDPG